MGSYIAILFSCGYSVEVVSVLCVLHIAIFFSSSMESHLGGVAIFIDLESSKSMKGYWALPYGLLLVKRQAFRCQHRKAMKTAFLHFIVT